MPSNRVDQVSFNGALKNHQRRISILEAVPPSGGTALPPWIATTTGMKIEPSAGSGDTDPTCSVTFAQLMAQTDTGATIDDGGNPVPEGTFLAEYFFTVTDPGAVKSGGNSPGYYIVNVSPDPIVGAVDPSYNYQIGSCTLIQDTTVLHGALLSSGAMIVGGYPDLYAPPGGFGNIVRVANPNLTPATSGWPWEWVGGETVRLQFMFPMLID